MRTGAECNVPRTAAGAGEITDAERWRSFVEMVQLESHNRVGLMWLSNPSRYVVFIVDGELSFYQLGEGDTANDAIDAAVRAGSKEKNHEKMMLLIKFRERAAQAAVSAVAKKPSPLEQALASARAIRALPLDPAEDEREEKK